MSDKEVYEKFMSWMGMKLSKTKALNNKTVVEYRDTISNTDKFTTIGYDEFFSGAIFDNDGNILKAYLDSHAAWISDNAKHIDNIMNKD
tara:strand:- start:685 stop:951 length:267 start_codon:yes stop_codon:yes gene_type:complete